jgi:hypothetical protein
MPSITSWTRLEPRSRSDDMRQGLQARIHDPLWLLARQWQLAEFKGEDAGSPVMARLRAETSRLLRYYPGPPGRDARVTSQAYDSRRVPLETLVEREPVRRPEHGRANLRLAAEAGLHFLRLLDRRGLGHYRDSYLRPYALQPPPALDPATLDGEARRFLQVMAGRVPDGFQLYADLRDALRPAPDGAAGLPPAPTIADPDRTAVIAVATVWVAWFETHYSEPAAEASAWQAERLEYAFAVSAPTSAGELVLAAPEYAGGQLDWDAFNVHPNAALGATAEADAPATITRTVIPAPVRYRGMPADRWWEFEDAQVDFGAISSGPLDLMQMVMMSFALEYGNDWFMLPIELEVGSLCRIRSLVVTDSFGERSLIRSAAEVDRPRADWRMFSLTGDRHAAAGPADYSDGIFLLPPVLAASLHSVPIEDVVFLRDELANMAWAVERTVEDLTGRPLNRFELSRERPEPSEDGHESPPQNGRPAALRYRLTTGAPDYWTPLLPVRVDLSTPAIRLRRGRLLRGDAAEPAAPQPLGRILEPGRPLNLFEEEVPRAGARVTRTYQFARWVDGSTHVWIGRRKGAGRGEGYSGLRFDLVEPVPLSGS